MLSKRETIDNLMNSTDKESFQIHILRHMLADRLHASTLTLRSQEAFEQCQQTLQENELSLQEAIKTVNRFLCILEEEDAEAAEYLKISGFYRILYRNAKVKGEELPENDILKIVLRNGLTGIAISGLIIILFLTLSLVGAPSFILTLATGLFAGATAYLGALLYGVVNDYFATNANLPYFLLGHQPQQASLLRTNNKTAQAIAWGIAATFGPALIAGIGFAIVTTITAFFVPIATYLLPIMILAMPLIAFAAEKYAQSKIREHASTLDDFSFESVNAALNNYQKNALDYMCTTAQERGAWFANGDRNLFGFTKVPLIGLGALVGMIILSAAVPILPLASPILAIVFPVFTAVAAVAALAYAGHYMLKNQNEQVDDRYKLEFGDINPDLYLDDEQDRQYIESVILLDHPFVKKPSPAQIQQPIQSAPTEVAAPVETSRFGRFFGNLASGLQSFVRSFNDEPDSPTP